MRITVEADYAVRIVYFLAEQEKRVSAKDIAENVRVTMRFTLKILRKLVLCELAKSYQGSGGGYVLAKKSDQISVLDVIHAIDGPVLLNKCLESGENCEVRHGDECCFKSIWLDLSRKVEQSLKEVTFAELLEKKQNCCCTEK